MASTRKERRRRDADEDEDEDEGEDSLQSQYCLTGVDWDAISAVRSGCPIRSPTSLKCFGTLGHLKIALVFHWLYFGQHMGSPKSLKCFTGYTLGELWAPKIAQMLRWLLFRQHLGILKSLWCFAGCSLGETVAVWPSRSAELKNQALSL